MPRFPRRRPPARLPRPAAEPPTLRAAVEARILGETPAGLPRHKKLALLAFVLGCATLGAVLAAVVGVVTGLWTARPSVEAQQDAGREIDLEKAPFTAAIEYDRSTNGTWKYVLDRALTAEEARALTSIGYTEDGAYDERLLDFLLPLGGRLVGYRGTGAWPSFRPVDYDAAVFTMTLFSERTGQLSITGMEAVDVRCRPSRAKAVVDFSSQGSVPYDGVRFDLTERVPVPYITDPEPADLEGEPYFDHKRIDLGGGASPGALRVEALVEGESCEWAIRARYRDAAGNGGEVSLADGDRPFFAEALPSDPVQYWTADVQLVRPGASALVACHEESEASVFCP